MTSGGRELALRILNEFEGRGAYAEVARGRVTEREPDVREKAFAQELAYGTLRHLLTIDYALARHLRHPLEGLPLPIRNVLRMGAYELCFAGSPAYAAVSQAVELAKRHGHHGTAALVNAVLRRLAATGISYPDRASDPVRALSIRYSCPAWMVRRWLARLGEEETEALCAAFTRVPPLAGRTNVTRIEPEALRERLRGEGVKVQAGRYRPECFTLESPVPVMDLPSFREGLFSLQDEGSALVAPCLQPRAGELVVDACSAPGTKTAHLLELMGGEGELWAVDANARRLLKVVEGCRRLGLGGLQAVAADARQLDRLMGEKWGRPADKVLVDAPCSGLGALARRPDLRWRRKEDDLTALAALQIEILHGVARALAPGGALVYSTCTTETEENEEVISAFLSSHPEFKPGELAPLLPPALQGDCQGHFVQLWPHRHGTDGFFICRLEKGI